MSAYVVGNETVNCIVNGLIDNDLVSIDNSVEIGQLLYEENQTSVNVRYRENVAAPPFNFTRKKYTPQESVGCVKCWMYQTCEYDGHEKETGWQLAERLLLVLSENYKTEDYPWGLD